MSRSRIELLGTKFHRETEVIHDRFRGILADSMCEGCHAAGFGEAVLTFALQVAWSDFCRDLVVVSALGTRRSRGASIGSVSGIRSMQSAEELVMKNARNTVTERRLSNFVWHATWFTIDVGAKVGLQNQSQLELHLGSALAPEQIARFRNYLAHPEASARARYDGLLAKLGMPGVEPEDLLHKELRPGVPVFTHWVRELQRVAYASTS